MNRKLFLKTLSCVRCRLTGSVSLVLVAIKTVHEHFGFKLDTEFRSVRSHWQIFA